MSKHIATTTQGAHPWRATIRTLLAVVIALAAMAEPIYAAATLHDPAAATGPALAALAIAGATTRVLALPVVESFLQRFLPWLAASARGDAEPDAGPIPAVTAGPIVIYGDTSPDAVAAAVTKRLAAYGDPVADSHEPTRSPDRDQ